MPGDPSKDSASGIQDQWTARQDIVCAVSSRFGECKAQRLRLHLLPDLLLLSPLTQSEIGSLLDRLLTAGLLEQHEVNRHRPHLVRISGRYASCLRSPALSERLFDTSGAATTFGGGRIGTSRRGLREISVGSFVAKPPSAVSSPSAATALMRRWDGLTGRAASGEADHGTRIDSPHVVVPSFAMREASKTSDTEPSPSSLDGTLEDWHWTWRLAGQGFALFECAAIRRKTMDAILRDLESAVRAGRPFSILDLLDRDAGVPLRR